jgi:hypothetical protein
MQQRIDFLSCCVGVIGAGGGLPCGLGRFLTPPVTNGSRFNTASYPGILGKLDCTCEVYDQSAGESRDG